TLKDSPESRRRKTSVRHRRSLSWRLLVLRLPIALLDLSFAQWLQYEYGHQRSDRVQDRRGDEHRVPAPGRFLQHVRKGHQQRSRALGRVHQTGVGGGELGAERIGRGG